MNDKRLVPASDQLKTLTVSRLEKASQTLPDGPVRLWVALISTENEILGASPLAGYSWVFKGGRLALLVAHTVVEIIRTGEISNGILIAERAPMYSAITPYDLTFNTSSVNKGNIVHLTDTAISFGGWDDV